MFHAEAWTDMTKPIVAFRNFANIPKKGGGFRMFERFAYFWGRSVAVLGPVFRTLNVADKNARCDVFCSSEK